MTTSNVLISEVGPRDGLQNCSAIMPTEEKKRWISALAAAGVKEIEVGSFVSPKLLPQMADTGEIVRHAVQISGLEVAVLVPNLKGAQLALQDWNRIFFRQTLMLDHEIPEQLRGVA